jgi:hypothetical protein
MLAAKSTLIAHGVTGRELDRLAHQAGRQALVQTVEQLTGLTLDHYAEINLAGFYEITQAVGGVPVCLTGPTYDSYTGADFAAGPQTVSGATAWPSSGSATACHAATSTASSVSRLTCPAWPISCCPLTCAPTPARWPPCDKPVVAPMASSVPCVS